MRKSGSFGFRYVAWVLLLALAAAVPCAPLRSLRPCKLLGSKEGYPLGYYWRLPPVVSDQERRSRLRPMAFEPARKIPLPLLPRSLEYAQYRRWPAWQAVSGLPLHGQPVYKNVPMRTTHASLLASHRVRMRQEQAMSKSAVQTRSQAKPSILAVGIDIAKETFSAALYGVDASGADRYANHTFANAPSGIQSFLRLLDKQQATSAPLCMEATGRYWEALALALHQAGLCVSVVNPARLKAYATATGKRTKTDKADAQSIAHFCAKQTPDPWQPPTPERRELQALSRHLDDLKQERTRHQNRRQALPPSPLVRKSLDELVHLLDEQIADVEAAIERLSQTSAEFATPMALLCSIPGIGAATAIRLLAEMPAIAHFASVRQLAAYAGLHPAIRQSGKSLHKGSLSKQGNRHLRTALFYPALSAMEHNPLVKPLVTRMQENGKAKKQRVAAAMRKLLHIVYGVLKSGQPFNPALAASPVLT